MPDTIASAPTGQPSAGFLGRLRLVLLVVLLVILAALLLRFPFEQFEFWAWDFSVFRAGSRALLHGTNPYDPDNVTRFADGAELASIPVYVYSPFFAVMISPLALLDPGLASRLWFLINLLSYLGGSFLVLQSLDLVLGLALALYAPLRTLLLIGQSAGLIFFLLCFSYWLHVKGRMRWAGVSLGLALFKPHLLLIPIFLAARRQWSTVTGIALAVLVTTAPFLGVIDDWFDAIVATRELNLSFGCVDFASLPMLLDCLSMGPTIALIAIGMLSLVTAWMLGNRADLPPRLFLLQLASIVAFSILVIDNVRVADQVLLVFPMLVSLKLALEQPSSWRRRAILGLLLTAFLVPYLSQFTGLLLGTPILYSLPIWYTGVSLAVYLAILGQLFALRRSKP
jgi:hypothetical protein